MGANDVLALEANFKGWQEKRFPVPKKDLNVFEYYCIDQFLRPFDLSDGQLKIGMTGGGGDGGVDSMYMFVNGELIDAESQSERAQGSAIDMGQVMKTAVFCLTTSSTRRGERLIRDTSPFLIIR